GFRVFRWERYWNSDGQPFRDPADYPPNSVAASGTHDTEPLVVWWEGASESERRMVSALPTIQRVTGGAGTDRRPYYPDVRDPLLEALFASRSNLVLIPVGDAFGWRNRINDPSSRVAHTNWTFRLPWPADLMDAAPEACERQAALRGWGEKYGRR